MSMRLPGKQIMLIDDDQVLRTLLTRVLTAAGCVVISCDSVKDALAGLVKSSPDLIILDLKMPEHNGATFLQLRRKNKLMSAIPVIVLSGTKDRAEIQNALEMGADQFLEKPFETAIILQKIRFIFLSKDKFVYALKPEEVPTVDIEIAGEIVEQCVGRLKVESQVRFCGGKAVTLTSDDYLQAGGAPVVCKVDSQLVELSEGLFRTSFSATGLEFNEKAHFESWQRSLSK